MKAEMKHDEADLISRCQGGDEEAMKEIFDQYREKVYRIAYGVVRHREDALDIVQEVFIKVFRSIKNFEGKSRFYTYLYRMAMNTAIDHSRRTKKMTTSSIDEEGGFVPVDAVENRPDRIAAQKELEDKLKKAMDGLPADQKTALIFREVEGLSYQEMAEAMGCSIGTVMSRLHYGRKKVQESLREYLKERE
jgi:RNA polymerase sigma-70 factor (ECF subfamily)